MFVHFLSPLILYQKENILCIKVENRLTIDFKDRSRKKGIISVICFTSDVSLFDLQATYRSCLRLTIRVLRGRNITVGGLEGMSKYLINICTCSKWSPLSDVFLAQSLALKSLGCFGNFFKIQVDFKLANCD